MRMGGPRLMIGAPIRAVFLQRRGISMYTYCLFCETGKCGYVARAVMQRIPCRTLSPKQVQHTWAKGKMVDIEHDLLPGYVFVYTENERLDVALLRPIQGIIRCLSSQPLIAAIWASITSSALWGRILVDIPTAIPSVPWIRTTGIFAGKTTGSLFLPS